MLNWFWKRNNQSLR